MVNTNYIPFTNTCSIGGKANAKNINGNRAAIDFFKSNRRYRLHTIDTIGIILPIIVGLIAIVGFAVIYLRSIMDQQQIFILLLLGLEALVTLEM